MTLIKMSFLSKKKNYDILNIGIKSLKQNHNELVYACILISFLDQVLWEKFDINNLLIQTGKTLTTDGLDESNS